jgi:short-subunit dehydrogenase
MVNRKEEQGNEAMAKIREETKDAKIEWIGCDLGDLHQVQKVFTGIREREERLDIVSQLVRILHVQPLTRLSVAGS